MSVAGGEATILRNCYLETGRKADCCGCEACASICPVTAVTMVEDEEGFRYPVINEGVCIGCGHCEVACGLLAGRFHAAENQRGFGGAIKDAVLLADSTSGGAFTAIASAFLEVGGSVFGAEAYEVYKARHSGTTTVGGLAAFRGSKYVQSEVGSAYRNVCDLLRTGERVLFSGTPCQVAGLYGFLGRLAVSPLLLTVEVICEGAPTPQLIERQMDYVSQKRLEGHAVESMRYRDKRNISCSSGSNFGGMSFAVAGWDFQASSFTSDAGGRWVVDRWFNPFWSIWLQHLVSRPSCAECPFARRERVADVTLGDLWGVHLYCPDLYNDDKGASLIVCNTQKGLAAFEAARPAMACRELSMADVVRYQGPMRGPTGADSRRAECMADLRSMGYREFVRKWAKRPTLRLLVSKYVWGTNKQVCAKAVRKAKKEIGREDDHL